MVNPKVGFQPRTTPAERRADYDAARQTRADITSIYTSPDTFTGPITVDRSATGPNYISNKTTPGNVDGTIHISIRSAGTEIGRITRATSTTAGFLTTSDADLKENFAPVDDETCLLFIRITEPLYFNYKDRPDVRHVGYNAQQTAEIWPNAVASGIIAPGYGNVDDRTFDEDGNETTPPGTWQAWMLDHSKITPVLHAGLRTLDRIIEQRGNVLDDHANRIATLEQIVDAQATQIANLQAALGELRAEIFYTRQMTADWQYSNTTTANPGTGQLRTNPGATIMWLHRTDTDGMDRKAALDFLVAATTDIADSVRFRIRGATGSVLEVRTNGKAVDNGTYYTVPIRIISGDPSAKGFRVEITMLSEIWAEDPPPRPTLLPT